MNKQELVAALQAKLGCSKREAARNLDALVGVLKEGLSSGEDIKIYGFGSFTIKQYGPRTARNPRTGAPVQVGPRKGVKFKPSKTLLAD